MLARPRDGRHRTAVTCPWPNAPRHPAVPAAPSAASWSAYSIRSAHPSARRPCRARRRGRHRPGRRSSRSRRRWRRPGRAPATGSSGKSSAQSSAVASASSATQPAPVYRTGRRLGRARQRRVQPVERGQALVPAPGDVRRPASLAPAAPQVAEPVVAVDGRAGRRPGPAAAPAVRPGPHRRSSTRTAYAVSSAAASAGRVPVRQARLQLGQAGQGVVVDAGQQADRGDPHVRPAPLRAGHGGLLPAVRRPPARRRPSGRSCRERGCCPGYSAQARKRSPQHAARPPRASASGASRSAQATASAIWVSSVTRAGIALQLGRPRRAVPQR